MYLHPTLATYGSFVAKSVKTLQSTPVNNNNYLNINLKSFPAGTSYSDYLAEVRSACDQKLGAGLFDVLMLEATVLGDLSDCLLDLSQWDTNITRGFSSGIIANSFVNGRLVSLPTQADLGVIYYNIDLLEQYGLEGPPSSFDDIEAMATKILTSVRAGDNFALSGITAQFAGEYLTAQAAEWLRGYNHSQIINSENGFVAIETNAAAQVIQRISEWTTTNIVDPNDFLNAEWPQFPDPDQIATIVTSDPSVSRFAAENSVFLRHWASTFPMLSSAGLAFDWGVGPVVGWDANLNIGAVGGWGVGVYKYSSNPVAAVKVAAWLSGQEMQRGAVVAGGAKAIPTRVDLYSDPAVCRGIGQDLCHIFLNATPALRPSSLVGHHYKNVSKIVSSELATFFLTEETVIDALSAITTSLLKELNQTRVNNTITIDPSAVGKKIPSHLQIQLLGLCAVILITCTTIYLIKRKQIDDSIKQAGKNLKTIASAAKQEVIMKTQKRADLDYGANEFTHLDEDAEPDDSVSSKRAPLARKGGNPGRAYSIVDAEKDDFI
ncbi:hypothetical protein HDU84_006974 [Entophlyctis sp. JEL0112]|nr:hypothetical protein HDU84_006974 [Entophlyctis sp. JEL0112]